MFLFLYLQNEISEVFNKLNENDTAIKVIDTGDCSNKSCSSSHNESPQRNDLSIITKKAERPSLRATNHNHNNDEIEKSVHDIDEWNSLTQFEKFVKLEMENLATASKNHHTTTTTAKNNILKPEKHVSVAFS